MQIGWPPDKGLEVALPLQQLGGDESLDLGRLGLLALLQYHQTLSKVN